MPNLTVKTPHLTGGGWSRAVLYALTVIAAVIAGVGTSEGWAIADTAQSVVLVLAALTGGTATLNIAKAPDQHQVKVTEVLPALGELLDSVRLVREQQIATTVPVHAPSTQDTIPVPHLPPGLPHFDRE